MSFKQSILYAGWMIFLGILAMIESQLQLPAQIGLGIVYGAIGVRLSKMWSTQRGDV